MKSERKMSLLIEDVSSSGVTCACATCGITAMSISKLPK